jgi:hypothetical protein
MSYAIDQATRVISIYRLFIEMDSKSTFSCGLENVLKKALAT